MAGRLWVPVASGPLASYAAGYGSWLLVRGYSRWTVSHRLWQLNLLSCWLEREGLAPGELTPGRVRAFLDARRAAGYSTWLSVRSTALPLAYLVELGVVPDRDSDRRGRSVGAAACSVSPVSVRGARVVRAHRARRVRARGAFVPVRPAGSAWACTPGPERGGRELVPRGGVPEARDRQRAGRRHRAALSAALLACGGVDLGAA